MPHDKMLDALVKSRLRRWPQHPPGLKMRPRKEAWLRGRPSEAAGPTNPFLKMPGSINNLRTLPDGLWLNFGGTYTDPYVDIFAIEACSTLSNFLDKRSRFSASTHSILAVCPLKWLLAPVSLEDPTPRWKVTRLFAVQPSLDTAIPVREVRVLFGLKKQIYNGFARHQMPHAHEFYVPMETLTEENCQNNPALRALVDRASVSSNFLDQG